ncbi:hypothetical protein KAR48_13340 [bacterium]|nr:hypothetical protein [bacterium]
MKRSGEIDFKIIVISRTEPGLSLHACGRNRPSEAESIIDRFTYMNHTG